MGTPRRMKQIDGGGTVTLYEKGLTLIHPFFGEDQRFKLLINNWSKYPQSVKDKLKIIIVDDHGVLSIKSLLTPSVTKRIDYSLTVYEIEDDLKHNTPGALNLGMMVADTEWILIMDSDCTFSSEVMDQVMGYLPLKDTVYKFRRLRVTEDKHLALDERCLPCTMLMHKNIFFKVNGFDEDFTGSRSKGYAFFDNHFDRKVVREEFHINITKEIVATEWMEDIVGPKVARSDNEERINRHIMYAKLKGEVSESREILRFSWKKVYENTLCI